MSLHDRLQNWGYWWRDRVTQEAAHSAEGAYRSPQCWHPPEPKRAVDIRDANELEDAVGCIPVFHHCLLTGAYVFRWPPNRCLALARKSTRTHTSRRQMDYQASMAMAIVLLTRALEFPKVIRNERKRALVRNATGLPKPLDNSEI